VAEAYCVFVLWGCGFLQLRRLSLRDAIALEMCLVGGRLRLGSWMILCEWASECHGLCTGNVCQLHPRDHGHSRHAQQIRRLVQEGTRQEVTTMTAAWRADRANVADWCHVSVCVLCHCRNAQIKNARRVDVPISAPKSNSNIYYKNRILTPRLHQDICRPETCIPDEQLVSVYT